MHSPIMENQMNKNWKMKWKLLYIYIYRVTEGLYEL